MSHPTFPIPHLLFLLLGSALDETADTLATAAMRSGRRLTDHLTDHLTDRLSLSHTKSLALFASPPPQRSRPPQRSPPRILELYCFELEDAESEHAGLDSVRNSRRTIRRSIAHRIHN